MVRVFVSHSSEDATESDRIRSWLVDDGHEVFLDHDLRHGIAPGEDWERRLHERLRWAEVVVCVVTSAFTRSTWCTAEVAIALSRGVRVVPVLAEPGVRHPLLTALQYLEKYRQLTPDEPNAYDSKGEVLMMAGRFDEARDELERAMEVSPSFHHSASMLALIRSEQGDVDRALLAADQAIAAAPTPATGLPSGAAGR